MARRCSQEGCLHVEAPRGNARVMEAIEPDDGVLELEGARVVGVKSAGIQVDRASVDDVVLEGCDLANAVFARGSLTRVRFVECKLTGATFGESVRLEDVVVERCILDDAVLDGAELVRVAFVEARLTRAGLRACRCNEVAFEACDLAHADLSGVVCARGSTLRLHACALGGAVLDARIVASLVVDAGAAVAVVTALGAHLSEERARVSCALRSR